MNRFCLAFIATALLAVSAQAETPPEPVMVTLTTGSRIATWTMSSPKPARATPVVFLHGGPGLYTEARRFAEGAPFREAGFTTIYFDQAGGGKSDRLPAREYTLDRAIADLEALRVKFGQDRLVLWGNSYGASLAAIYAARFPDRVAALVLTSPGSYPGTKVNRNYAVTNRDKVKLSKAVTSAVGLIDKSGADAEPKLSQTDAGRAFDETMAAELIEAMVCKGATVSPPALSGGGNLYANRLILKQVEKLAFKPVNTAAVPTLIVRGACDYLPESNAAAYATQFRSTVTTIAATGHGMLENRVAVEAAITGFVSGPSMRAVR
jgi:pimeloyl-ACP methyl ester carboxylesterase